MLPDRDGFSVIEYLKQIGTEYPIIFLTARGLKKDQIRAYSLGADDYLIKPFDPELLLLKIEAILRRNGPIAVNKYKFGTSSFDYAARCLRVGNVETVLSPKEATLLKLLIENKNRVLERKEALIKIWKSEDYFTARSMDVYISKLRKYLDRDQNVRILNVHGSGFRLITEGSMA